MKGKLALTILTSVLFLLFSGCYDSRELDDLAYVSAIGLDKGKTNALRLTVQIMLPHSASGEAGGGGGAIEEPATIATVETPSIYSGFNMINTYITKELNVSHAKLLVISEELAREGIGTYIHAMIRGREFRNSLHVAVSKCSAEEYLKEVKPVIEQNVSEYHQLRHSSYSYTGFTAETTLIDFYLNEKCTCTQPVAVLCDISKFQSSDQFNLEGSTYQEKGRERPLEGDFTAGEIPQIGEIKNEIMGLAVFDGDRMVGEIDGGRTSYYLMVTGNFKKAYFTMPDPLAGDKVIVLNLSQQKPTRRKSAVVDSKPYCEVELFLEANIVSIQSGINYDAVENLRTLEMAVEDMIQKGVILFLEKTAKEFGSDICGLGKDLKKKMTTWEDWEKVQWLAKYKDASFNVKVNMQIRRPGLMLRTTPIFSTGGEKY